jgi:hypothetical protein
MSWFGLRLLNVSKGALGFSDAIDMRELPVAGSLLFNIFGCFVFVTVLMHVSQVGLPVFTPIDESDDMIDLSTANRNTKAAITAQIVSSPYNSTLDPFWYRFVMVFFQPFINAARH